jgi:rsbT antagonist protein RsbS
MAQETEVTRVPIQSSHGCLVASIQIDLDEEILARFQRDLLERLHRDRCHGVILDVSGVELMDVEDFESLCNCIAMARVLGARSVLVGLQPGVVSALVDLDIDTSAVEATQDLEEAFEMLQPDDGAETREPAGAPEPEESNDGAESPQVDS